MMTHTSLQQAFVVEHLEPSSLRPDPRNARTHSHRQINRLAAAISEFGFTNPILVDEQLVILAGHARLEAAIVLGLATAPCIRLEHLTKAQKTALAIADNKLGDMSEFDPELLAGQLSELCAIDFPVELTGFDTAEVDILLEKPTIVHGDSAETLALPDRGVPAVTRQGDLWILDNHRLLCGSALEQSSYERLLNDELAEMIFADPPYNVPIQGHVSGLGRTAHAEFAMAAGEMSPEAFTAFLSTYMVHLRRFSADGSIHFHCMDWRHLQEILAAGASAYTELKSLCVWNKNNGGMGSLYRSKHELVLVYKSGTAPHINNVNLGRQGRYRTNVWDYAGVNTFGRTRDADLAAHPTVKPVALVADTIRDCSKRGGLILDPFAGSGTTILAAERTGRRAAAIELDRHYVDTAVRRWQQITGGPATLSETGQSFDEVAVERADRTGSDDTEASTSEVTQ